MKSRIATQICHGCGAKFDICYYADGGYEYIGDVCDCEDGFSPDEGEPSIGEWLATLKEAC